MKTVAKLLGLFLILLGVPLLVAVIFATGVTRAAVSEEFYTNLSEGIVKRLPGMMEKSFEAARQPGAVKDPRSRAWIEAMAKAETPFPEMLNQTGIRAWLEGEVAGSIEQVGQALKGEAPTGRVVMDMRPLKQALAGKPMRDYLHQVLVHLPPCDQAGLEAWGRRAVAEHQDEPLPACRPAEDVTEQALQVAGLKLSEIPDEAPLFRLDDDLPAFDFTRLVHSWMWLLFLLPALLLLGGGALAGGGRGLLRLGGGSVLAGGLIALLLATLAGGLLIEGLDLAPAGWTPRGDAWIWNTAAGREFASEIASTVGVFLNDLFGPVVRLAWIVSGVGLGLLVLGFLAGGIRERTGRPA